MATMTACSGLLPLPGCGCSILSTVTRKIGKGNPFRVACRASTTRKRKILVTSDINEHGSNLSDILYSLRVNLFDLYICKEYMCSNLQVQDEFYVQKVENLRHFLVSSSSGVNQSNSEATLRGNKHL